MLKSCALAILVWASANAAVAADSIPSPSPTPTLPDSHAVYLRCVQAMQDNLVPRYLSYVLHVRADHIDVTRAYDSAGYPTTTLHFGAGHKAAAYVVHYRADDARSSMRNLASGDLTVGPPVPWPLDLTSFGATAPTSDETVNSGSLTTDAASKLLGELRVDQSRYYRIVFAANGITPQSYVLTLASSSGDPNAHALRELVVDAQSYRVLAATFEVGQRHFLFGGTLRLHVAFSQVGQYWLNTSGTIVGHGHYAFIPLSGSYAFQATRFAFPEDLSKESFTTVGRRER